MDVVVVLIEKGLCKVRVVRVRRELGQRQVGEVVGHGAVQVVRQAYTSCDSSGGGRYGGGGDLGGFVQQIIYFIDLLGAGY